jgi:hypothetical protein
LSVTIGNKDVECKDGKAIPPADLEVAGEVVCPNYDSFC